jgi:hypothetical protein
MRQVALVLTLVVFVLSFYFTRDRIRTEELRHLGAEYYNVARALVDGRGYADPFGEATGPTAWMPPLYCLVLAGLSWLLQTKTAVAIAIIGLQDLTLIGIGVGVYAVARRRATRISPLVSLGLYVVWVALFHYWFFILTTDIWLIAGLAMLMVLAVTAWLESGTLPAARWGLLAGVATLVSPALATAWSLLMLVALARSARSLRSWVVALSVAGAIALPWVARNAMTFGKLIPTKSNLGYELYLANVVDDDGVYDNRTLLHHPLLSPAERFEYDRLGEIEFIASNEQRALEALSIEPASYLRRVGRRFLAAILLYAPAERELNGPFVLWLQRLVYCMPLLFGLSAFCRRSPQRPWLGALGLLVALTLAPYVMIAFYSRYVFPLTPLLIVLWFVGLDLWVARFARAPRASGAVETASIPRPPPHEEASLHSAQ